MPISVQWQDYLPDLTVALTGIQFALIWRTARTNVAAQTPHTSPEAGVLNSIPSRSRFQRVALDRRQKATTITLILS